MNYKGHLVTLFFTALIIVFSSCGNLSVKPQAIGKPGQVLVVAEDDVWEGVVGEAFREYFIQPFPVLPQPEPYFELRRAKGSEMESYNREMRVIIILGNVSENNPTSKLIQASLGKEATARAKDEFDFNLAYRENLWASNQLVVYLFGPNDAQLIENIQARYQQIEKRLLEVDHGLAKANAYIGGTNRIAKTRLKEKLGVFLDLPVDFKEAIVDSANNAIWYRRETAKSSSNIIIKVDDYNEANPITVDRLLAIRDSLGKKYITSAIEGAYMTTDRVNMPIITEETSLGGNYAIEARGIWAMENDFMGGAFISYLVYDPDDQKIIFLDGFLYAPDEDKRPTMQRFEAIFETLEP